MNCSFHFSQFTSQLSIFYKKKNETRLRGNIVKETKKKEQSIEFDFVFVYSNVGRSNF
jgi:hypothetical protein